MIEQNVFVYGTLKDAVTRKSILSRNTHGENDMLTGFRIEQIILDGITYPAAVYDACCKKIINGITIKVTPDELKKIDEYESEAYIRTVVKLESGTEAWIYLKA